MPKARNRKDRAKQILGWLQSEWPAGRPVDLRWVKQIEDKDAGTGKKHQCHGQTYRVGRRLKIELSLRKCRTWEAMTETLIHEYAHAVLWGPASIEHSVDHHPVTFYALMGEIQNRWDHDHGAEQANGYPF